MQNPYDTLIEKNLIHIVSDNCPQFLVSDDIYNETAVAVNLYYEDTLEFYFTYLENIPDAISIYIYSANEMIWKRIEQYVSQHNNVFFYKKENRGRDLSAFLVAFREIALKKQFLCFLHDKKEKSSYFKEDTVNWIKNLWGNTVCSKAYIQNVLGLLNNSQIGILTPPIPFGEHFPYWYINRWGKENFSLAEQLICKLKIKCSLERKKIPITLGSVFWCRMEAIRKILEYEWSYEDFDGEPLPDNGTVSHAMERIFAYAAQDAGYSTAWIMCSQYAQNLILRLWQQGRNAYEILERNGIARNPDELVRLDRQRDRIEEFCRKSSSVFLYGAGFEGRRFANWMHLWGLRADGFVVTDKTIMPEILHGIPIYAFGEISVDKSIGVIITVGDELRGEIEEAVRRRGIVRYYIPYEI